MNEIDIQDNPAIETTHRAKILLFSTTTLLALLASQLADYLVYLNLQTHQSWEVTSWLFLTHIRNHGGVFGIFQGQSALFSVISGLLLMALVVYLFRNTQVKAYECACFGFIFGGGLSNIADRWIYGSVIDYFDVRGIPNWHYIFNTADVMIHVGLWSMILISIFLSVRGRKEKS